MKTMITRHRGLVLAILACLMLLPYSAAKAQDLTAFRKDSTARCMDYSFMHDYVMALRRQKPVPMKEYRQVSDKFVLIACFYRLMKYSEQTAVRFDSVARKVRPAELLRLNLPLSAVRKTQLEYLAAADNNDVAVMTRCAKALAMTKMPADNMCDPMIYGFCLLHTVESGKLSDSKQFVAWLKDVKPKIKDSQVAAQVKSVIDDGEGYIMLKEYEASHQ